MKITHFDQSGFMFETEKGFKLALDIGAYTPVEKLSGITADAVLVSHLHPDHLSAAQITALAPKRAYLSKECQAALTEPLPATIEVVTITSGHILEIGGITVTAFDVDHGPNVTVKPTENFGFILEAEGDKVYFGGDIFYPSGMDVTTLEVSEALLPVGGHYTFDAEAALQFALTFKKIGTVAPMHWLPGPENKEKFLTLAHEHDLNTVV